MTTLATSCQLLFSLRESDSRSLKGPKWSSAWGPWTSLGRPWALLLWNWINDGLNQDKQTILVWLSPRFWWSIPPWSPVDPAVVVLTAVSRRLTAVSSAGRSRFSPGGWRHTARKVKVVLRVNEAVPTYTDGPQATDKLKRYFNTSI